MLDSEARHIAAPSYIEACEYMIRRAGSISGLILGGIASAALALLASSAIAAEGFHPKGLDGRRRAEEEGKEKERRQEEPTTKSRDAWQGQDLTSRTRREIQDLSGLEASIKADSQKNAWKTEQANHAWERRGESEFEKLGILDAKQLQAYAESVRLRPDIQKELDGGKSAYGQFHEQGGKKGTIVIDNPRAENGGTIITNGNIESRMRSVR